MTNEGMTSDECVAVHASCVIQTCVTLFIATFSLGTRQKNVTLSFHREDHRVRKFIFCAIALLCLSASNLRAETPAELEILGATALKLSQTEPDAIVSAAINYGKATEMNSFLYW